MLPSLVRIIPKSDQVDADPEDIFTSALGLIFTDDSQNCHGDHDSIVGYRSRKLKRELLLQTADVNGETERRKFAHYVWNAGILMAEVLAGKPDGVEWRVTGQFGLSPNETEAWWLTEKEQEVWRVKDENVLELGAGVGLGGMASVFAGATSAVISDYPAPVILETIKQNVTVNLPASLLPRVQICGHTWGDLSSDFARSSAGTFTHILAADCLWMPHEHFNLASSMSHFLSTCEGARVHVIAGFHTGRANVAAFFREAIPRTDLTVESICECDVDGRRRTWNPDAVEDHAGERKKWLVIAVLQRSSSRK